MFIFDSFSKFSLLFNTFVLAAIFAALFFITNTAHAADLLFNPSTGSYTAGQTFTATIQVDPSGQAVNSAEASVSFDPALLSVVSVSKDGSVFSLWVTEPEFSNSAGTITFGGGSPSPINSRANVLTVTFRAVAEGTGTVTFDEASVLAADGRGTEALEAAVSANYTITAATTPVVQEPTPEPNTTPEPTPEPEDNNEPTDATIAFGEPPRAPAVGSQTFIDPNTWYATNTALFAWELPFDITAVAIDVATSSEFEPVTEFEPPIEEIYLTGEDLNDGIQYLTVQFKNQVGWGAVAHRKIMIDTQAPEEFVINVQQGNSTSSFPFLTFEAYDETSGVERYEFVIDNREPEVITPDEAKLGYLLGELKDGTYTAYITAYDLAGNKRESSVPVRIEAGWLPASETEEERSFWAWLTPINIFLIILIILNIVQFVYAVLERRHHAVREEKLRKETREIQDQMEKIFSALRDEIYDQINTITKRPRLSKKEREAVEGLNNALEVSETLIEKEINDVKKILK